MTCKIFEGTKQEDCFHRIIIRAVAFMQLSPERRDTGQEDVGHDTQRPDVTLRIGRILIEEFRSCVRQEGSYRDVGSQFRDFLGTAHVADLDFSAADGLEQDIVWLEVQVSESAPVQVLQSVQHLQNELNQMNDAIQLGPVNVNGSSKCTCPTTEATICSLYS